MFITTMATVSSPIMPSYLLPAHPAGGATPVALERNTNTLIRRHRPVPLSPPSCSSPTPLSFICIHLFLHPLTPKRQETFLNGVEITIMKKKWLDLIAKSLRKQITDLLHFRGSLSQMSVLMHKCKRILTDWTQPRILLTFLSLFLLPSLVYSRGKQGLRSERKFGGFVSGTRHFGVAYLMCLICYGNFEFFPRVTVNSGSADWMRLRRYTEFSLCCTIS